MNIAFDPWIPVVTLDGEKHMASLCEILTKGGQFADLAVRPHERVALMRLLTCVAHAAMDGPKDDDEWETVPQRLPTLALAYLNKWREAFEVFHPSKPWLQVADLSKSRSPIKAGDEEWTPVSKLGFFMATGSNSTLFDHEGACGERRGIALEEVLLSMLAFQNFSPGGLIAQVYWGQRQTGKSSKDAPCVPASMVHAFLRKDNLADTLHCNLPTLEAITLAYTGHGLGRPVWEIPPIAFEDKVSTQNATQTYMGRLVPMTRAILLHPDGKRMLLGDGLVYPPYTDGFPAEPTATVIIRQVGKKQDRTLLPYRPSKAVWRELGSMIVKKNAEGVGGPLSLGRLGEGEACDLVVVALARDQATIIDTMEAVYHIPGGLCSPDGAAAYEAEIAEAEAMARRLGWAIEEYRSTLDGGWDGRMKGAGAGKGDLRAKLQAAAMTYFWTAVEKQIGLLMEHLEAIGTDEALPTRGAWRRLLFATGHDAYRSVCGQESPRQMRAFAEGWKRMNGKAKATDATKEEEQP